MIGYKSKFEKAQAYVNRNFNDCDQAGKQRVLRQMFAKMIVGEMTTIGKNGNTNKFYLKRDHPHDGINNKSEIQRPWAKA
jgi:hypothetical protein